jgi:hypothetical protein
MLLHHASYRSLSHRRFTANDYQMGRLMSIPFRRIFTGHRTDRPSLLHHVRQLMGQ